MKIPQEYFLLIIIGLFVFAYLLDLVVEPLQLRLTSPYEYFQPQNLSQYPFSSVSIFIKALAVFLTPLWVMAFFSSKGMAKPSILLVLSALLQLYAIQDVVSRSEVVPLEWALSFSLAGLMLLPFVVLFFIRSMIISAHANLTSSSMKEAIKRAQEEAKEE
jgi:hypothetical protein